MASNHSEFPKVLTIYLELSQYPILALKVREHMRQELFKRGVITPEAFEAEVQEKAVQSQNREGLSDPFSQEPPEDWINRQTIVRDHLTDFYFAHNLPHALFEDLLRQTLSQRVSPQDIVPSIHAELAPLGMLFTQGEAYEALDNEERVRVEHHLEQIHDFEDLILALSLNLGDPPDSRSRFTTEERALYRRSIENWEERNNG